MPREWSREERDEVLQMLRYLHAKLGSNRPLEEDFFCYVLKRWTVAQIRDGIRVGVEAWKWMPQPSEVVSAIRQAIGDVPALPLAGCADCHHGWRYVEDAGPRRVTPCRCEAGQLLLEARQKRLARG